MSMNIADERSVEMMGDMLSLATRTADSSSGLAIAAGQVIAKRVALGMAAAVNPMAADHAEFARMVPEKVEAFSAAGLAMLEQSRGAMSQIARLASADFLTTARATIEIATSPSPLAMLDAQARFTRTWLSGAAANLMTLGMMAIGAQAATLQPLRLAVAANNERLT